VIAFFEHTFKQAPHFVQVISAFPFANDSSVMAKFGQLVMHLLQSMHLFLSIDIPKRLILLEQLRKAPIGQKKLH
jgi:hypothetical protein